MLYFNVALLLCLMTCQHIRAQCTQPSFLSRNVILSGSSLPTESFPNGSNVTFECMIGHTPVNSRASKSVTCREGQWTSLELTCTKKSCGSLPEFHNGRYVGTGILFGDTMTAVCNTGYMLAGQMKDRLCRDQGWDGRDPVCEVVKCDPPPTIENGQLEEEPKEHYEYLQVVSYKCNSELSLIGSKTLHCSEDGTFKPDPPKCMDGCPKPEIKHATRIGGKSPPYKLHNFVDYECDKGYTMKGENHIVCSAEGWKPDPPKCIGPCSKPVFGGHVTLTDEFRSKTIFPFESKVTFECMTGYEPVNSTVSKSVTCEETNWTKLLLTCKVVQCKEPPTIENGQLEKPQDSYDYLQEVSYKCNSGFTLTGHPTLRCSEDKTFKPEPPECLVPLRTTTTTTTATTSTKVTSKIQPKDVPLRTTTTTPTATTSTKVTSKIQLKDENQNPPLSTTATVFIVLGALAVVGIIGWFIYKKWLKREDSEKMEPKNEVEALNTPTQMELTP